MAFADLAVLPIGLLFFVCGLVVNFIEAVVFILVRPFSKRLHRRINKEVVELIWLELIWLFDWWANMKVEVFADAETIEQMGKEHALVLCNHKSDIDWLVGYVLAQRSGCLGSSLALIKKEAVYLPVIGWLMWFSDYIFLERSWAKDQNRLKTGLDGLRDFPVPFWLALFVEGTRFTKEKLLAAQEFARSAGLPVPKNVLIPRTKGFVTSVIQLRSFVPAIYNMTLAIPKDEPWPTILSLFRRRSSVVQVHIERHLMDELPETEGDIAQWCKDLFVAKDALLENHLATNTFSNSEKHDLGRPKRSLLVVIAWTCLILSAGVKFFLMFPFTWEEIAVCVTVMVLISVLMQLLIVFSQSEQPKPPGTLPPDTLKESLLPK